MRPLIFIAALAIGAAHAEPKQEALDSLLKSYQAESGDIDNLLALRHAVNDAVLNAALAGLDPGNLPTLGEGDNIIYEFSDYRCGFCRRMFPAINRAVADGKVKVVLLELPVLGELSDIAARHALAAHQQGRFPEFHRTLMTGGRLSEDKIAAAAKDALLDEDEMQAFINSDAVEEQLQANYQLALLLNVNGTPAFIINGAVYRGALKDEDFLRLLEEQS